jgi:hypothetical protein
VSGRPLVTVCAWCDREKSGQLTREAEAGGAIVSHGICAGHALELRTEHRLARRAGIAAALIAQPLVPGPMGFERVVAVEDVASVAVRIDRELEVMTLTERDPLEEAAEQRHRIDELTRLDEEEVRS